MADVKWIKLAVDIFDNRKIKQIERMPEGDSLIVVWLKLLVLAGCTNDQGFVYFTREIPYTEQLLSNEFNRPLPIIQLALRTFQHFGMIEIVEDVIHISNWEKYQNIEGMDKIREQNRVRQQRFRAQKKVALIGDGHVCVYCGGYADTVDHVIPKAKLGADVAENTVPCCLSCNMEKTNDDLDNFLNRRLVSGEAVDIDGILRNPKLAKYVDYDGASNRFKKRDVTLHVTQGNATDIDKDKELDKEIESNTVRKRTRFTPPTIDEVKAYCTEQGYRVDAERFVAYYESNGWKVGKNPMKDWRAAVRTWVRNDATGTKPNAPTPTAMQFEQRDYTGVDFSNLNADLSKYK